MTLTAEPEDYVANSVAARAERKVRDREKFLDNEGQNDFVVVDKDSGTVFGPNLYVVEYPEDEDDQNDFEANPSHYVNQKTLRKLNDRRGLSGFKDPVVVDLGTGTYVAPDELYLVDHSRNKNKMEGILDSDSRARDIADELGSKLFD